VGGIFGEGMASRAYSAWFPGAQRAWDEIESAHAAVGGKGRGRRYATQQINQAYAVSVSAQFQSFCRGLHSDAADVVADAVQPRAAGEILRARIIEGRKLDTGNANPANLGSDFGRLGIEFWQAAIIIDPRNVSRKHQLEQLNVWRNAIAHQYFDPAKLRGITHLHLEHVRRWRRNCEALALSFDETIRRHLQGLLGASPW
jgi:hypothetical protein